MIKTIEQARTVQEKRVAKGKQGHSKAVRAFLKRNLNLQKLEDYNAYLMLKQSLPSLEIKPKSDTKAKQERTGTIMVNGADVLAYMKDQNDNKPKVRKLRQ